MAKKCTPGEVQNGQRFFMNYRSFIFVYIMGPGFKHWNSFRTLCNAVHFLCPSQFSWLRLIADKGPKHLFFLVVEPWVESIWFPIKEGHLPAPFVRLETSRLLFLLSSLVLPESHACSINQQTLLFSPKRDWWMQFRMKYDLKQL